MDSKVRNLEEQRLIDAKIEEIKKKEELIKKRRKEIEEDKRFAEQQDALVNLKPSLEDWLPDRTPPLKASNRISFGEVEELNPKPVMFKGRGRGRIHDKMKNGGPPPDPVSFLADPERDLPVSEDSHNQYQHHNSWQEGLKKNIRENWRSDDKWNSNKSNKSDGDWRNEKQIHQNDVNKNWREDGSGDFNSEGKNLINRSNSMEQNWRETESVNKDGNSDAQFSDCEHLNDDFTEHFNHSNSDPQFLQVSNSQSSRDSNDLRNKLSNKRYDSKVYGNSSLITNESGWNNPEINNRPSSQSSAQSLPEQVQQTCFNTSPNAANDENTNYGDNTFNPKLGTNGNYFSSMGIPPQAGQQKILVGSKFNQSDCEENWDGKETNFNMQTPSNFGLVSNTKSATNSENVESWNQFQVHLNASNIHQKTRSETNCTINQYQNFNMSTCDRDFSKDGQKFMASIKTHLQEQSNVAQLHRVKEEPYWNHSTDSSSTHSHGSGVSQAQNSFEEMLYNQQRNILHSADSYASSEHNSHNEVLRSSQSLQGKSPHSNKLPNPVYPANFNGRQAPVNQSTPVLNNTHLKNPKNPSIYHDSSLYYQKSLTSTKDSEAISAAQLEELEHQFATMYQKLPPDLRSDMRSVNPEFERSLRLKNAPQTTGGIVNANQPPSLSDQSWDQSFENNRVQHSNNQLKLVKTPQSNQFYAQMQPNQPQPQQVTQVLLNQYQSQVEPNQFQPQFQPQHQSNYFPSQMQSSQFQSKSLPKQSQSQTQPLSHQSSQSQSQVNSLNINKRLLKAQEQALLRSQKSQYVLSEAGCQTESVPSYIRAGQQVFSEKNLHETNGARKVVEASCQTVSIQTDDLSVLQDHQSQFEHDRSEFNYAENEPPVLTQMQNYRTPNSNAVSSEEYYNLQPRPKQEQNHPSHNVDFNKSSIGLHSNENVVINKPNCSNWISPTGSEVSPNARYSNHPETQLLSTNDNHSLSNSASEESLISQYKESQLKDNFLNERLRRAQNTGLINMQQRCEISTNHQPNPQLQLDNNQRPIGRAIKGCQSQVASNENLALTNVQPPHLQNCASQEKEKESVKPVIDQFSVPPPVYPPPNIPVEVCQQVDLLPPHQPTDQPYEDETEPLEITLPACIDLSKPPPALPPSVSPQLVESIPDSLTAATFSAPPPKIPQLNVNSPNIDIAPAYHHYKTPVNQDFRPKLTFSLEKKLEKTEKQGFSNAGNSNANKDVRNEGSRKNVENNRMEKHGNLPKESKSFQVKKEVVIEKRITAAERVAKLLETPLVLPEHIPSHVLKVLGEEELRNIKSRAEQFLNIHNKDMQTLAKSVEAKMSGRKNS